MCGRRELLERDDRPPDRLRPVSTSCCRPASWIGRVCILRRLVKVKSTYKHDSMSSTVACKVVCGLGHCGAGSMRLHLHLSTREQPAQTAGQWRRWCWHKGSVDGDNSERSTTTTTAATAASSAITSWGRPASHWPDATCWSTDHALWRLPVSWLPQCKLYFYASRIATEFKSIAW